MVAYLTTPTGSDGFQEIVDFLNGSHIRQPLNKVSQLPQTSEPIPNVADEAVYEDWNDRVERAATTAASLDAKQDSGGSPRCQEAMGVPLLRLGLRGGIKYCSRFIDYKNEIESQESRKEEEKGKKSKTPEEEIGRSMIDEIDQDVAVTLVQIDAEDQGKVTPTQVSVKGRHIVKNINLKIISTGSGGISTASRLFSTVEELVSTASASMSISTTGMVQEVNIPSPVAVKDKSKGKMEESKDEQTKRTKLQQEQDRLGYEATMILQEELD
uniref:Uncharacterized protein n=1 Tax=Tanacetum cinerariifolium TaxID=118510 RepID=A0A699J7K9_TANCI|nr:hypothetical protein [Tanacetum cinerariifolium]